MTEIGLGTVQLGLPYGNSSNLPIMSEEVSSFILQTAAESGIRFFDTAAAYGESESRIGRSGIIERFGAKIEVSTKIPPAPPEVWKSAESYWAFLTAMIKQSKSKLNLNMLGLLQFHQSDLSFLKADHLSDTFERLISEGFCQTIGISVYTPEQAMACLKIPNISALQVPFNILDRRFFAPHFLESYQRREMRVIGRSIFLQGVLIPGARLPIVRKMKQLEELRQLARQALGGTCLYEASLAYAKFAFPERLKLVILGIDSIESLEQNLKKWKQLDHLSLVDFDDRFLAASEFAQVHDLLNPSTWNN